MMTMIEITKKKKIIIAYKTAHITLKAKRHLQILITLFMFLPYMLIFYLITTFLNIFYN